MKRKEAIEEIFSLSKYACDSYCYGVVCRCDDSVRAALKALGVKKKEMVGCRGGA